MRDLGFATGVAESSINKRLGGASGMGETWVSLDGDKDSSRAMSIKDSR